MLPLSVALVLLCQHQQMPKLWNPPMMSEQQKNNVAFQLSYRKAERDKADLQYENQMLRSKITTLTTMLIVLLLIFVAAIVVNASK